MYGDCELKFVAFLINTKVGMNDLKYKIKISVYTSAKLVIIALLGLKDT